MTNIYSRQKRIQSFFISFICLLMLSQVWAKKKKKLNIPLLVKKTDIKIFDEDNLRRYINKKGWVVPGDFWLQRGKIEAEVALGKFGKTSGKIIYSTFRPILPLSDEEYVLGKKSTLDNQQSNLVMPPFELKLDYITFLISGANAPNKACINLLLDGKVIRTATGRNSDYLEWVAFDVKEFKGKKVRIQILDASNSFFDYINVDCICQSPDSKGALRIIKTPPKKPLLLLSSVLTAFLSFKTGLMIEPLLLGFIS